MVDKICALTGQIIPENQAILVRMDHQSELSRAQTSSYYWIAKSTLATLRGSDGCPVTGFANNFEYCAESNLSRYSIQCLNLLIRDYNGEQQDKPKSGLHLRIQEMRLSPRHTTQHKAQDHIVPIFHWTNLSPEKSESKRLVPGKFRGLFRSADDSLMPVEEHKRKPTRSTLELAKSFRPEYSGEQKSNATRDEDNLFLRQLYADLGQQPWCQGRYKQKIHTKKQFLSAYKAGQRDFSYYDFSGLDLSGLKLRDVNFCGTQLEGASLSGTTFEGECDFRKSIYAFWPKHLLKFSDGNPVTTCKKLLMYYLYKPAQQTTAAIGHLTTLWSALTKATQNATLQALELALTTWDETRLETITDVKNFLEDKNIVLRDEICQFLILSNALGHSTLDLANTPAIIQQLQREIADESVPQQPDVHQQYFASGGYPLFAY